MVKCLSLAEPMARIAAPRHLPAIISAWLTAMVTSTALAEPVAARAMRIQAAAGTVLLDGRCDEPAWLKAVATRLDEHLTMLALGDRRVLTVCWRFPLQALSIDLYIEDRDGALHDLHLSAQAGERTRTPDGWRDWTVFGQHRGWYAPPFPFAGFRNDEAGTRRIVFTPQPSRELQLTKARFGPGPWRIMVEVQAMEPGSAISRYPAGSSPDDPSTWGRLVP